MDITQLILDDHHEQRRLFAILEQIDRAETEVLSAVRDRLASFLELHAAAEEAIFYPALLQAGLAAQRKAGVAFAAFEARNFAGVPAVDRDPATYVREAEEDGQASRGGSLSIGSLKRG